jgi:hypothetical protein
VCGQTCGTDENVGLFAQNETVGVNICEYVETEMQSWLAFLCALQFALLSASAFAQDFNDLQKAAEQDDVQAQNCSAKRLIKDMRVRNTISV